jgi:predicted nucleic acid-binding protein
MKLVVDANVLFSFFKRDSTTRKLIIDPELEFNLELFTPADALEELKEHGGEICSKFGISQGDFDVILSSLSIFVTTVPKSVFKSFLLEAEKLLPENPDDVPYIALGLKPLTFPNFSDYVVDTKFSG